ncbi:MAG: hypothetical protein H0X66_00270 [Verrucomicrobia bacterium]|nr:hypothetical protein [Verrucomicrobiota bacterium]
MNKKTLTLISVALVLGAVYLVKFTDWFAEKNIQILFRMYKGQPFFGLENKEYHLTSIKVVKVEEASTNKYAPALWHVVAADPEKGSAGLTDFIYGQKIDGMGPAIPEMTPTPLVKNTNYRILLEAGKVKGEREFALK